jgi:hypothetical protein
MRKMITMANAGFPWKKFQARHVGMSAERFRKYDPDGLRHGELPA